MLLCRGGVIILTHQEELNLPHALGSLNGLDCEFLSWIWEVPIAPSRLLGPPVRGS